MKLTRDADVREVYEKWYKILPDGSGDKSFSELSPFEEICSRSCTLNRPQRITHGVDNLFLSELARNAHVMYTTFKRNKIEEKSSLMISRLHAIRTSICDSFATVGSDEYIFIAKNEKILQTPCSGLERFSLAMILERRLFFRPQRLVRFKLPFTIPGWYDIRTIYFEWRAVCVCCAAREGESASVCRKMGLNFIIE